MRKAKRLLPIWRGGSAVLFSIMMISALGYNIANTWRATVDEALGTKSFITDSTNAKYVSSFQTPEQLMNATKAFAVRQGAEGTVIMKNDNGALPLVKNSKLALFGGAAYDPYINAALNTDMVRLVGNPDTENGGFKASALEAAGFTIDTVLEDIYAKLFEDFTIVPGRFGQPDTIMYKWGPNKVTGDYTTFKISEANPAVHFESLGNAAANWKSQVTADTALVVFSRPGGEGTTYLPNSALDNDGNPTGKSPLALSDDELAVVKAAKEACDKVVVLLNSSSTIEVGPLLDGEFEVDGLAYIGIPNDYQFTGIIQALSGDVNPTGALADTYAIDTQASPAMMNFGGGYYSDYGIVADFEDTRWPGVEITNLRSGSFGGSITYSGGWYMAQAEGIYTGYTYYETRYYDSVLGQGNAASMPGSSQGGNWDYSKEVAYGFGHGLSYLPYEQTLKNVRVEDRVGGEVTAEVEIKNTGTKAGKFLAQLYVQAPYTAYNKQYNVEKSAIQFLNSAKVEVPAGGSRTVEIKIPTKYIASYDYTNAKTYIMDGGTYYFATGAGAHAALNNVLTAQGRTGDAAGNALAVKTWTKAGATDTTTYAVSDSGGRITNVADNADLNYYLPGAVTYLSRKDWSGTYPINYNTHKNGDGVALSDSPKLAEWLKELRNQQYIIKTNEPETNMNGIVGPEFNADSIGYDQINDINDPYWENLVNAITAEQAVGAVAHGGSRSDTLTNINNPVVVQNDGPQGFNRKPLSTNNGVEGEDEYFADPNSEAGKFKASVNAQTLLGSSFDPELALEWGRILGNTGLWIRNYQIWGGGLNYHRTPYNGRNNEYLSEDPMLTNVLGAALIKGTNEFGIINGPKHIGFNDQEFVRSGVSVYMNEQKLRETDLRGFQGAVEEGKALGLMVAFNRIGAINASHHVGVFKDMVRGEWGFKGLISTDLMNNKYYFNPEGCIMATITQMADFGANNSTLKNPTTGVDGDTVWPYLSEAIVANDATLVEAAREALKYQLYAFANSAVLNISTVTVTPWWETAFKATTVTTASLSGLMALVWIGSIVLILKKDGE